MAEAVPVNAAQQLDLMAYLAELEQLRLEPGKRGHAWGAEMANRANGLSRLPGSSAATDERGNERCHPSDGKLAKSRGRRGVKPPSSA